MPETEFNTYTYLSEEDKQAQFERGKAGYERGDYDKAIEFLRKPAMQDHIEAQFYLGRAYTQQRFYELAIRWLTKAAKQKHPKAQYYLGEAYFYGKGVVLDYNQALKLYQEAAVQGDKDAEKKLDNEDELDKINLITTQESAQAKEYSRLANQENLKAKYNLATAFNRGKGVLEDHIRAKDLWREAAELGHTESQYRLGLIYYEDTSVDDEKAIELWHKAAEQGHIDAQYRLGKHYYENEKLINTQAVNWWQKAAELGHTDAQYYLGNAYYNGWDTEKPIQDQAIEWWKKAAEQGHIIAQYNLGVVCRKAKDNQNALQYFDRVANTVQRNALVISAQYLLGIMYKKGEGCSQNYQKARVWLKQTTGFEKGIENVNLSENDRDFLKVVLDEENIQEELITIVQISAQQALEDIAKLEEQEKANQELENMMGLIAHKFRGSIQVISYNAQNENQPSISLDSVETMRGLFEIFGIISTRSENLCEKLIQDKEGEGTILTTLEKSLSLALTDLLIEDNRNKISQHYIAYAKVNKGLDINVTLRQWRRKQEYLVLWKQLQTQWQNTFMLASKKFDWVQAHLFPLEIATFDDNVIHFEHYGMTESILVIAMTEIILNAIKYYSVQENTTVKIGWKIQPDFCIFSCENPYSENESKRSDKGSRKGQIFLETISKKLGGHFSKVVSQNHYIAELKIPTHLLIEERKI